VEAIRGQIGKLLGASAWVTLVQFVDLVLPRRPRFLSPTPAVRRC
jgi:hypothetical protein